MNPKATTLPSTPPPNSSYRPYTHLPRRRRHATGRDGNLFPRLVDRNIPLPALSHLTTSSRLRVPIAWSGLCAPARLKKQPSPRSRPLQKIRRKGACSKRSKECKGGIGPSRADRRTYAGGETYPKRVDLVAERLVVVLILSEAFKGLVKADQGLARVCPRHPDPSALEVLLLQRFHHTLLLSSSRDCLQTAPDLSRLQRPTAVVICSN